MSESVILNERKDDLPLKVSEENSLVKKPRQSGIELFRIITMLMIVVHHYVVNSGVREILGLNPLSIESIILLNLGAFGKIGINCFVLITGYFMCKSNITLKKFLKLFLEVMFYKIIITTIFIICKYPAEWNVATIITTMLPLTSITSNFTGCYLIFFLFIPFLNILIKNINEKMHGLLLLACLIPFTVIANIPGVAVSINYVLWFIIIYFIGAYIRLYKQELFSKKWWSIVFIINVILCIASVIAMLVLRTYFDLALSEYFFVVDCNKILAVTTAVSGFITFKNANIKYSKFINVVASACFGVLLIHANSGAMRTWLWGDMLKNVEYLGSNWIYLHFLLSILIVYIGCTLIDLARIYLIEKPLFKWMDKKLFKKEKKEQN